MTMTPNSSNGIPVSIRSLRKSFGHQEVLKGLEFEIRSGEVFVLMGPSGSGKSVFLRHLIGLESPHSGEIRIGNELATAEGVGDRFRLAMVFQSGGLLNSLTVAENVGLMLAEHRLKSPDEIQKIVADRLALVRLGPEVAGKLPSELSGGMRKRVGLARAIVYRPSILLYDEPTTGLDPVASARIDRLIRRVWEQLNVTSIAVTHDMKSARTIGNRIVMLHEGRIHADGTSEEIFASTDPILHNFVNGIATARSEPS